jgi:sugar lactone lactonase YvrE
VTRRITACTLVLCALAATAWAVKPVTWTHQSEADFKPAEQKGTVVDSYGEVLLARQTELLMTADQAPPVVSDVVAHGKALFAADGTGNGIYRIADGKVETFAEVPSTMIACLQGDGKRGLLVGTGGQGGGVYRVDLKGRTSPVWTHDDVTYVWALLPDGKGGFYAATGTKAAVWHVDADGNGKVLYEVSEHAKNILCLAYDAKGGVLYAGTDEKGLILAINPTRAKGRVVYDAAEKEIAALAVHPDGGVYAATSDASKARAEGEVPPSKEKEGRSPTTAPADVSNGEAAQAIEDALEKTDDDEPAEKGGADDEEDADADYPTVLKPGERVTVSPGGKLVKRRPTTQPAETAADEEAVALDEPAPRQVGQGGTTRPAPSEPVSRPTSPTGGGSGGAGNAVYFVRPSGVVETVFRRPVTILDMRRDQDGTLYLATGNGGGVYSVSPDGDRVVQLAEMASSQVTSLARRVDGTLVFSAANKGAVAALPEKYNASASLISKPLDAKQIALWGTVNVSAAIPDGTKATIATRSGNLAKPDDDTWSDWSKEIRADGTFAKIPSPAGRFIQYRLTLTSEGEKTPTVRAVQLIHQVGNLAPSVPGVTVKVGPKGGGKGPVRALAIKATDRNGDKLTYSLAFREVGGKVWTEITDDLAKPQYLWNTRTVADGVYEVKVTASDAQSNAPRRGLSASRISPRIVVDNTAPQIKNLTGQVRDGSVIVTARAVDEISRIESIYYAVDSGDWQTALPIDEICDDTTESIRIELDDLKPGAHRVAVRVADRFGNASHGAVTVTVEK